MKKILFIVLLLTVNISCSQTTKKEKYMYDINNFIPEEAKGVTTNNYADKLYDAIKNYHYTSSHLRPAYYFKIHKEGALVRIYVNDVNIYDDYELSNTITPVRISNILQSGKQEFKVKLFPVGHLRNQDLGKENTLPETIFRKGAKVDIEIIEVDKNSSGGFEDEKVIKKMSSPDISGQKEGVFSFSFDAEVPYTFEAWAKGQDLRTLDQELVRKKAVEFYEMVGEIFEEQNLDAWLKLNFQSDVRFLTENYGNNISYLRDILQEYKQDMTDDGAYTKMTIKNFKLEYMGNGKLLRLINKKQEIFLRGGGALLLKYGEDGIYAPAITLYLPQGRDLETQGFMMWP